MKINIPELNYLVLATVRDALQRDLTRTAALFALPPALAQRLRAVSDADLRRLCAAVPAPLVRIPADGSWFTTLTCADTARTIDWDAMARYRAAAVSGGAYVA